MTKEVHALLNSGKYLEAKDKALNNLNSLDKSDEKYLVTLAEIAGLLIDIGSEGFDLQLVESGIKIIEEEDSLKKVFTEASYFYCLGNGKEALYKINNNGKGLPSLESIRPNLIEAKNYYYKSFKKIDLKRMDHFTQQVLTNLGHNLSYSGRIVEAIQLYNMVLNSNPNFPNALLGFAENLDYWLRISFSPKTISLYATIYDSYRKGYLYKALAPNQKDYLNIQLQKYRALLEENNFSILSIEEEYSKNSREYENHTLFRKFCIDNFLTLNEHSLYCKCYSASHDNLGAGHSQLNLYHEKLCKMELLLNRLKSEFGLARKLFYEGSEKADDNDEIIFNELMDGEVIGEANEKIRTSFKMCFSIFDRIAHGICYFFDLNPEKQRIYFEGFWEKPKIWAKIKDMRNPHLVALYSIANDFTNKGGEFHFYKEWRNKLEHSNLILVDSVNDVDLLKLFNDESFVTKVSFSLFKEQALHLLQICCASIYSYTYLIRTESMNSKIKPVGNSYVISPKVR